MNRRSFFAGLASLALAHSAVAGLSRAPFNPLPPIPANGLTTTMGDSRAVQDNLGSASTAGGSVVTFLTQATGGRMRASGQVNAGIGGTTEQNDADWPRPITLGNMTASFSGQVMNITASAGGDTPQVGEFVNSTGHSALVSTSVMIDGNSTTGNTDCGGGAGSCTGAGTIGTYHIDTNVGTLSARTMKLYYKATKTIAEVAAGQAAVVGLVTGTNSSGAGLVYTVQMMKGLTVPGWPYPNYRPNGEGTDQPLPLYPCTAANTATCRGLPKVVIAVNDFRRGCDWQGTSVNASADNSQLERYANNMLKYDFASGLPESLPNVVVIDTRHRGGYMDTSAGAAYTPKCGWHPDGLHSAPTLAWWVAQEAARRLWPSIVQLPSYAVLADTTNLTSSTLLSPNGTLTGTSGSVSSSGGVVFSGQAPNNIIFQCLTGCSAAVTITGTINPLGGTQGNEFCGRFQGPSSTAGSFTITMAVPSTGTSGRMGYSNVVSTDLLRMSYREHWSIKGGLVITMTGKIAYNSSQVGASSPGTGGSFSAGAYMLFHGLNAYPWADTSHDVLTTSVTSKDATGLGTGGIALSNMSMVWTIGWNSGADATDITYCVAQPSLFKVN